MNTQRGFTLIELLAAGLISTIVAGVMLTVLYMSTEQIKTGSAETRLQMLQAMASEQISASARNAFGIKHSADPLIGSIVNPELDVLGFPGEREIKFYNEAGNTVAGYKVKVGDPYLWEYKPAIGDYVPFQVGGYVVEVDETQTVFGIIGKRKGVTFRIAYRRVEGGVTWSFPPIVERVLCRNCKS